MFGSGSGSGSIWVKFGFGSFLSQPCAGRVQFGSCEARVQVTYGYYVRIGTGLVQFCFGLSAVAQVRIGYRSSVIWTRWDSVQCLGQYRVRCKLNRV